MIEFYIFYIYFKIRHCLEFQKICKLYDFLIYFTSINYIITFFLIYIILIHFLKNVKFILNRKKIMLKGFWIYVYLI